MTPWNLLIYVLDRDDRLKAYVEKAVTDMHAALGSSASYPLTIVLQRDGKDGPTRFHLSAGVQTQKPPAKEAAEASLQHFLEQSYVSSASTAVIMWTHGTGVDELNPLSLHLGGFVPPVVPFPPSLWQRRRPLSGFGPDFYKLGSQSSFINDPEVRSAIEASKVPVDLLAFNACSMGIVEVLFEMADIAPIQVASPPLSESWPYGLLVDNLAQATSTLSATDLAEAIVASVQSDLDNGSTRGDAVFAFESANIKSLAAALDPYGQAVTKIANDPSLVKQVLAAKPRVGDPAYIDIAGLLAGIDQPTANSLEGNITPLLAPLASAKAANCKTLTGPGIFCPPYQYDVDAAYQGLKFASNSWKSALKAIQPHLPKVAH